MSSTTSDKAPPARANGQGQCTHHAVGEPSTTRPRSLLLPAVPLAPSGCPSPEDPTVRLTGFARSLLYPSPQRRAGTAMSALRRGRDGVTQWNSL